MKNKSRVFYPVFLTISALWGIWTLYSLLKIPSETQSAFAFGFSKQRLILIGCALAGTFLSGCLGVIFVSQKKKTLPRLFDKINANRFVCGMVWLFAWLVLFAILFFFILNYAPVRLSDSTVTSIFSRIWTFLVWAALICGFTLFFYGRDDQFKTFFPDPWLKNSALFIVFQIAYFFFARYYDQKDWNLRFNGLAWIVFSPVAIVIVHQSFRMLFWRRKKNFPDRLTLFFVSLFILVMSFSLIHSVGLWMGRYNNPSKSYWHLLAKAFSEGRLYLITPPTTHDLTLYQGKWYVPNPPLPALLLMPFAFFMEDAEAINMPVVSAIFGAINTVLIFLTLEAAAKKGMIRCSRITNVWLSAVVSFGTDHLWLATTGQMWFISQVITITFIALACLLVILDKSAWFVGLSLGMAMLSRPNVFPNAILLIGIYLSLHNVFPSIKWKEMISWGVKFAIPIAFAGFITLFYNYLRFDNWLDFGYVTINGADWIIEAVQKYGMFNLHFLRNNLDVMLFRTPRFDFSGKRFFFYPYVEGYSIFIMTPPLIYIFRRWQKNWQFVGAWVSVILTVGLLLCYHNTGAEQVGYRYILDAILPLTLLMAVGVGEKPSWLFKSLSIVSFVVSLISIYWWYLGRI